MRLCWCQIVRYVIVSGTGGALFETAWYCHCDHGVCKDIIEHVGVPVLFNDLPLGNAAGLPRKIAKSCGEIGT